MIQKMKISSLNIFKCLITYFCSLEKGVYWVRSQEAAIIYTKASFILFLLFKLSLKLKKHIELKLCLFCL